MKVSRPKRWNKFTSSIANASSCFTPLRLVACSCNDILTSRTDSAQRVKKKPQVGRDPASTMAEHQYAHLEDLRSGSVQVWRPEKVVPSLATCIVFGIRSDQPRFQARGRVPATCLGLVSGLVCTFAHAESEVYPS